MMAMKLYSPTEDEFDKIDDLRIHGYQYPTTTENVYRACLAGIRRQKY